MRRQVHWRVPPSSNIVIRDLCGLPTIITQVTSKGGESRLVTSFASPGPGWHGIGGMTEDYAKIGTALARGELAREPVPISTEESTSADDCLRISIHRDMQLQWVYNTHT